jgi:hypothetical protein
MRRFLRAIAPALAVLGLLTACSDEGGETAAVSTTRREDTTTSSPMTTVARPPMGAAERGFCRYMASWSDLEPYAEYERLLSENGGRPNEAALAALARGVDEVAGIRELAPPEVEDAVDRYVDAHEEYALLITELDGPPSDAQLERVGELTEQQLAGERDVIAFAEAYCADM